MADAQSGGEISLPHALLGSLAAFGVPALCRNFLLIPLLGPAGGKDAASVLAFVLFGYFGMAVAPRGQAPPPLVSRLRARSALIFGVVALVGIVVLNRLWPA